MTEVTIRESMRGVHPRLFMSKDEFAQMYAMRDSDPILKVHVDRMIEEANTEITVNQKTLAKTFGSASQAVVHALGRFPKIAFAHGMKPSEVTAKKLKDILNILLETPHWDTGFELDSGMGGSCVMLLAAMSYDLICDELEPEIRKQMAQKLFTHARRMYYLGHLEKGLHKVKYWQQDPANNHRWFRNKGLISCLLVVADEPGIEADWLMEQVKKEMDYVVKWFPPEGDCHESVTYAHFGFAHLAMSATMMDRIVGTSYLQHPGFANAWKSIVYSFDQKLGNHISYGDTKNWDKKRSWGKLGAFFIGPKISRDAQAQAALTAVHDRVLGEKESSWTTLAFYDPTVTADTSAVLPLNRMFPDLGVAWLRDAWDANGGPLFMFKCGPYGGYRLNEYRHSEDSAKYISVAHDDPDANTFSFILDGQMIAHPGFYDMPKLTANQNTILVNGKGQIGEGGGWLQPIKGKDMRGLSYLTTWQEDEKTGRVVIEGEAGNAYPDLKHFRRTTIWLPGDYVLILDDVAAKGEQDIAWSVNAYKAFIEDEQLGLAQLEGALGGKVQYQVVANTALTTSTTPHTIKSPKGNKTLQKTNFSCKGKQHTLCKYYESMEKRRA